MRFSIPFFGLWTSFWVISVFWGDQVITNFCFDFQTKLWMLEGRDSLWHLFFYSIPKLLYGFVIASLFFLSLLSSSGKRYFIVAAALVVAPSLVAFLKPVLGQECPKDLFDYAGVQPHLTWWEAFAKGTGRCFPGGHVSAGFGLYALLPLISVRNQAVFLHLITVWGSLMGAYQIVRGYHFLSHNLATLLICYLIALGVAALLKRMKGPLFAVLESAAIKQSF